jgi:hypothetical protein
MHKFALLQLRRRLPRGKWLAAAAFVVVACTGAAVAIAGGNPSTTQSVDATFDATTVKNRIVKTCTGKDGDTYEVTHATYTGDASSIDSRLDGPVVIRIKSIYNTTKSLGRVTGKVHGDKVNGKLTAVNTKGTLEGFLNGSVHDPGGRLFMNISADYSSAGGLSDGEFGTGSSTNTAIIFQGACSKAEGLKGPKGASGATGPKGPKGATGATGPKGPKGATGATGPKGPKGHKGPIGPKGHKGATGPTGPTGPKGPKK